MKDCLTSIKVEITNTEYQIAKTFCRDLVAKQVAFIIRIKEWTVKTHKKSIYRKLGIYTPVGIVLYVLCKELEIEFDIKQIREKGIDAVIEEIRKIKVLPFIAALFLLNVAVTDLDTDSFRVRTQRAQRTTRTVRSQRGRGRDSNIYFDTDYEEANNKRNSA